mgnify:CR=1 FL=1
MMKNQRDFKISFVVNLTDSSQENLGFQPKFLSFEASRCFKKLEKTLYVPYLRINDKIIFMKPTIIDLTQVKYKLLLEILKEDYNNIRQYYLLFELLNQCHKMIENIYHVYPRNILSSAEVYWGFYHTSRKDLPYVAESADLLINLFLLWQKDEAEFIELFVEAYKGMSD